MTRVLTEAQKKEIRWRKAKLVEAGLTHTAIARKLGIKRNSVSMVVGGFQSGRRTQKTISKMLDIPFEKLWGKSA